MKKIISFLTLMVFMVACTDRFDSMNTNSTRITDESLKQDFNYVGAYFPGILTNLQGHQTEEDLLTDSFVRHVGTPTPFVSGRNNTTYYVTWNPFWDRIYNNVMAPSYQAKKIADADKLFLFSAWAELLQVVGLSRLTAYHGPLIYSNYGKQGGAILYDSEPDLYKAFFKKLDDVYTVFKESNDDPVTKNMLKKFDATYGGDLTKWMKFINSMRLRLAIRISKADPVLAKTEGEKAINDPAGLILVNADNFNISLYGAKLPLSVICFEWNDTRMGAGIEEFLLGLKDPRIEKFFQPVSAANLYADHPSMPYKGIASGAFLGSKDDRLSFSLVSEDFKSVTFRRFFTAAEMHFALAEANLRGWNTPSSAQEHYETGVKLSFADWGAGTADAYLADDTSTPLQQYVDPQDPRNNYTSNSTITIKWNEADSKELKLEKILTQKWIDSFTNANEVWCDHRRTGYPKLHYVPKNDSSDDWGIIPRPVPGDPYSAKFFPRRWPYITAERNNNKEAIADAVTKMGGPDLISTPLWWQKNPAGQVDGPNF